MELKDAGFPQTGEGRWIVNHAALVSRDRVYSPTLEELVEACVGHDGFYAVAKVGRDEGQWSAIGHAGTPRGLGATPAEAVARLWLALINSGDAFRASNA